MKCPRCNAQLADNASFCGVCGKALSTPQNSTPEVRPSINNEATIAAAPWVNGPGGRGPQEALMQPNQPPLAPPGWSAGQLRTQQTPPTTWATQPARPAGQGASPEMQAGNLQQAGVAFAPSVRKKKRAGRVWASIGLILVLLGAILTAAWFLGVRPYVHGLAQDELEQALNAPESQLQLAMLALPPGSQTIHASENSMNTYLSSHDTDQIQNLHMTVLPAGMTLSFTTYGQDCSIDALPIVSNGVLQVTNVQVHGVLALIMSSDELTSELDSNLQTFSNGMTHKLAKVTLLDHDIAVQFR